MNLLYVAIGGAMGSVLRFLAMSSVGRWLGNAFPYSTLIVNVAGSFVMGMLVPSLLRFMPISEQLRVFVGVGILGGFTTFSTFSLDLVTLIERGEWQVAVLYALLSVVLGVLALFAGMWLLRAVI